MPATVLEAAVDAAAVVRLTILALDDDITEPIRTRAALAAEHNRAAAFADGVLSCPWCASVWLGIGVGVARTVAPRAWDPVARGLAASLLTGLVTGPIRAVR